MLLAFIVAGAVEDERTFWIQLLMLVILAAGAGAYVLVKSRAKRIERRQYDETIETIIAPPKPLVTGQASQGKPVAGDKPRQRNLSGGMELLSGNFLASVVEQTASADTRDVEMRRLCFAELIRRGGLSSLTSDALKVYILDEGRFYGKVIRSEAMAELAGRTSPEVKVGEEQEKTNEPGHSRAASQPQSVAEPPASPAASHVSRTSRKLI